MDGEETKRSFLPFVKNFKINNVEWFLPEAPYLVDRDTANESIELSLQIILKRNHGHIKKVMELGKFMNPLKC